MLQKILGLALTLIIGSCNAQKPPAETIPVQSAEFQKELRGLLSFSTPTIGVAEVQNAPKDYVFLDARTPEEYAVSHIPGALWIGYKEFDESRLAEIPKDAQIVVYCTVGYRSEKITERLQELGYSQSCNLIGSIFEWANQGGRLENEAGKPTNKIHTYSKNWGRWVENDQVEKVW